MAAVPETVAVQVGADTRYIISTSGRASSLARYTRLLQQVLKVDVAYLPISSGAERLPERTARIHAASALTRLSSLTAFPACA